MTALRITDHALLRYLERGLGVDIAGLRCRVAARVPAADAVVDALGEGAVIHDGLRFHLRQAEDGTVTLVTVSSGQDAQVSNRALRLRRRHAT